MSQITQFARELWAIDFADLMRQTHGNPSGINRVVAAPDFCVAILHHPESKLLQAGLPPTFR